tara:strand:- start:2114 stop:2296 length:183 start_codon:yes stop_codon:yes gene_type:complete
LFHLAQHRFSSIIPLAVYFDRYNYTNSGPEVSEQYPGFRMTTLDANLQGLCVIGVGGPGR